MFTLAQKILILEARLKSEEFFHVCISSSHEFLRRDYPCVNRSYLKDIFTAVDIGLQASGIVGCTVELDIDWVVGGYTNTTKFFLFTCSPRDQCYIAKNGERITAVTRRSRDLAALLWNYNLEMTSAIVAVKKDLTEKIAILKTLGTLRTDSTSLFSLLPLDVLQYCIVSQLF